MIRPDFGLDPDQPRFHLRLGVWVAMIVGVTMIVTGIWTWWEESHGRAVVYPSALFLIVIISTIIVFMINLCIVVGGWTSISEAIHKLRKKN